MADNHYAAKKGEHGGPAGAGKSADLMMPMCYLCVHFSGAVNSTCDAFPSGIPTEILRNRFDHRYLHPRQENTFLFKPRDHDAQRYVEYLWSLSPGPVVDPPPDDVYL